MAMALKKTYFFGLSSFMFVCMIIIITTFTLGGAQNTTLEKRKLASLPSFPTNFKTLREYPSQFDNYYRDKMGFRPWFTSVYSKIMLLLNTSPVDTIVLGKHGWLFYAGEQVLDDYRNISLFSEEQLKHWAGNLSFKQKVLAQRGIKYLFVVAPNKHTIYSENLPEYLLKQSETSRLDQLVDYLKNHTDVNFVDMRPALLAAKRDNLLYWPHDTHWNRKGAYVGYQVIVDKLISMGIEVDERVENLDSWSGEYSRAQDLRMMLGVIEDVSENGPTYDVANFPCIGSLRQDNSWKKDSLKVTNVMTSHCPEKKNSVIVFRDSFSSELVPLLANNFAEAAYIWSLPDETTFQYFLKPDTNLVIEERVERSLRLLPQPKEWKLSLSQLEDFKLAGEFEQAFETIYTMDQKEFSKTRVLNGKMSNQLPLTITTEHWNPQIFLPVIPFDEKEEYILEIQLGSPVATEARLFYQTADTPNFNVRSMQTRSVRTGSNSLFFKLKGIKSNSSLRFDPSRSRGQFVISSLQVRKV